MTYNGFYRRFNESQNFPEMAGKDLRAWFSFGAFKPGETLGVRVALSGVSTAGALRNLEAETAQPGFDAYRTDAAQTWNEALSIARIEALRSEDYTTFYTALYNSMLSPITYEDVDGQYRWVMAGGGGGVGGVGKLSPLDKNGRAGGREKV